MAITRDPLRQLVKQADSVAESSLALTRRTLTQLQGQLTKLLKKKPNLAGCAADRDTFYKAVKAEAKILSDRINVLQSRLVEAAGKGAARAAAHTTGMKVEYSEKRAKAIAELVTPAQGKNLAAVFTDNMAEHMIRALREATVQSIREQGAAGGTLKDQSRDLAAKWQTILGKDRPTFVDAAGRQWDGARYLQMNARTNAMRVYNDCLADDIARVSPSDKPLARISGDGDPNCDCGAWEGIIISLDGSDKRFPSYDDARLGGCFHPNCVHTLDYIDPVADEKEIDIQAKHPIKDGDVEDWDRIDERKYRIDQERYKESGLNADEARLAVDRDNLTTSLRNGLVDASARSIIDSLTDAQVTALCPNGNPPEFEPLKLTKRERAKMSDEDFAKLEKWNKGKYGGVVHIDREGLTAEKLLKVCKVEEAETLSGIPDGARIVDETYGDPKDENIAAEMREVDEHTRLAAEELGLEPLGHAATYGDIAMINPNFREGSPMWRHNCQRCVVALEMLLRGFNCTAKPMIFDLNDKLNKLVEDPSDHKKKYPFKGFIGVKAIPFSKRSDIEKQMKEWGDGSRAQITFKVSGTENGHTIIAIQTNGKTRFIDPQRNSRNFRAWSWIVDKSSNDESRVFNSFARIDNLKFSRHLRDCVASGVTTL